MLNSPSSVASLNVSTPSTRYSRRTASGGQSSQSAAGSQSPKGVKLRSIDFTPGRLSLGSPERSQAALWISRS